MNEGELNIGISRFLSVSWDVGFDVELRESRRDGYGKGE